ncbi:hypothetical protein ACE1AT_15845 [Pelatocladus sp. BLCC-F211]|uniref:hypothetical protein n=1 Tax=Pelatocladus sp. BLCC-F211 TaxID=3342752 RepID=UPI0035B7C592
MLETKKKQLLNLLKIGLIGCQTQKLTIPHPLHSLINLTVDIGRKQNRHRPAIHPQPASRRLGHSAEFGKH